MITKNEISSLNLSPTKKDFVQIWNELLEVASKITERWDPTSTNESDPGIVLLKVLAGIADKLNYNIDKNILEAYMPTAAQTESMQKLCELVGYNIKYYQSAETSVKIKYTGNTVDTSSDNTERLPEPGLLIPKFTTVTNADKDVTFVTTNTIPVLINNSKPWVEVPCIEGQISQCESLNENNLIMLSQLDDNKRYYLPETQIAENGIFVYNAATNNGNTTLSDGNVWLKVSNLNTQPAGSRVFKFGYDSMVGRPYITFPDDVGSLIGDGLFIYFIRTSGLNGNISPGTLKILEPPTGDEWSNYSAEQFEVVNTNAATNGANIESITTAYNNFKKTVGVFDTLVTCRDYMNKIYSLMDVTNTPYVSNILVTDIRNDINNAITLCSCNESGILYKEMPLTKASHSCTSIRARKVEGQDDVYTLVVEHDPDDITEEPLIDHFDLLLYPFKTFTQVSFGTKDLVIPYNRSFEYTGQRVENGEFEEALADIKTCAHNFKSPKDGDIVAINNYLRLNAFIATSTRVSTIEADDILKNIRIALVNEFNLRNLDFGEEIPFDSILSVIENADSRIKVVSLQEPAVLTTYSVKDSTSDIGSKEYGIAVAADDLIYSRPIEGVVYGDNKAKEIYNTLVLRNILAGRASLFKYDETFASNSAEKPYTLTKDITEELQLNNATAILSEAAVALKAAALNAQNDAYDKAEIAFEMDDSVEVGEERSYEYESILTNSTGANLTGLYDGVATALVTIKLKKGDTEAGDPEIIRLTPRLNVYETYEHIFNLNAPTPASTPFGLTRATPRTPANGENGIVENIARLEATCEISKNDGTEVFENIILGKNEVIKFRAPNFITTKTFPAYVYYRFEKANANGSRESGTENGRYATAETLTTFINTVGVETFFTKLWTDNETKLLGFDLNKDNGSLIDQADVLPSIFNNAIAVYTQGAYGTDDNGNYTKYAIYPVDDEGKCHEWVKNAETGSYDRIETSEKGVWNFETKTDEQGSTVAVRYVKDGNSFTPKDTGTYIKVKNADVYAEYTKIDYLFIPDKLTICTNQQAITNYLGIVDECETPEVRTTVNFKYYSLNNGTMQNWSECVKDLYFEKYSKQLPEGTTLWRTSSTSNYPMGKLVLETGQRLFAQSGEYLVMGKVGAITYICTDLGADPEYYALSENSDIELGKDDKLYIHYTPSSTNEDGETVNAEPISIVYTGSEEDPIILKPSGFTLMPSEDVHRQGTSSYKKYVKFPGEQEEKGLLALAPNEQIELRSISKVVLDTPARFYKNFDNETLERSNVNKVRHYELKDGEYIFYTDENGQEAAYYGSGSVITLDKGTYIPKASEIVEVSQILEQGLHIVPWGSTVLLNENKKITVTEYQYVTLVEGDTLNTLHIDKTDAESIIDGKYTIRSDWSKCDGSQPITYTPAGAESATTLPKIGLSSSMSKSWEVCSILELSTAPGASQTIRAQDIGMQVPVNGASQTEITAEIIDNTLVATLPNGMRVTRANVTKEQVTSAILNSNGELVVTFSDETTSNFGPVAGTTLMNKLSIYQKNDTSVEKIGIIEPQKTAVPGQPGVTEYEPVSIKLSTVAFTASGNFDSPTAEETNVQMKIFKEAPLSIITLDSLDDSITPISRKDSLAVDSTSLSETVKNYWTKIDISKSLQGEADEARALNLNFMVPKDTDLFGIFSIYLETPADNLEDIEFPIDYARNKNIFKEDCGVFIEIPKEFGSYQNVISIYNYNILAKGEGDTTINYSWWPECVSSANKLYLRAGLNCIKVNKSCNLLIKAEPDAVGSILYDNMKLVEGIATQGINLDLLDYNAVALSGEELTSSESVDAAAALLSKIRDLDKSHDFYYNTPIENSLAIEFDDYISSFSNPHTLYDINNINNNFVVSKLDVKYLETGLKIAKSSISSRY